METQTTYYGLLLFRINLLFGTSNQMLTYGKLNWLLINSIYFQKYIEDSYGPSYITSFVLTVLKETSNKPSRLVTAKNVFTIVCMLLVKHFSIFFVPYDNLKKLFFIQIYCYTEVLCHRHVVAFFETSVLKKVRIKSQANTKAPN